jgi:hypothetical protein
MLTATWLDRLIAVNDEILSSVYLDDRGKNTLIGGWRVERGFIWRNALNFIFCNLKESRLF